MGVELNGSDRYPVLTIFELMKTVNADSLDEDFLWLRSTMASFRHVLPVPHGQLPGLLMAHSPHTTPNCRVRRGSLTEMAQTLQAGQHRHGLPLALRRVGVRVASRSISPNWRPIRFRPAPRVYAPRGCIVRVVW